MTREKTFWGALPGRKIAHLWTPWGWASVESPCGLHKYRGQRIFNDAVVEISLQTHNKCKSCLRALAK